MKTKKTTPSLYILVEATNIDTDITASKPMTEAEARAALETSYNELLVNIFGNNDPGEFDNAECGDTGYQIFCARKNDMYYGQLKSVEMETAADVQQYAMQNLTADDADNRCGVLANYIGTNLRLKGISNHVMYGKEFLTAVMNGDMDELVRVITGKTVTDILREAYLAPRDDQYFPYVAATILGTQKETGEPFFCEATVNNANNSIDSIRYKGKEITGSDLIDLLNQQESLAIRVANMLESFRLYLWSEIPAGQDKTAFWY